MDLFNPLVKNYYKNRFGGGGSGGGGNSGGGNSGGGATEESWIGDGNTHIWITLHEGRTSPMLGVCPKGTVTVDWGDGSEPDVLTGTSTTTVKWTPNHQYAKAGDYVITLTVDGDMGLMSTYSANEGCSLCAYSSSTHTVNNAYRSALKKVEIGRGVTSINDYMFRNCYALESINIPDSVTSIGNQAFASCYALESINIPDSVTSIGKQAFNYCYALKSITIPDGVTSIANQAFYYCYALKSITIPDSVTSIASHAFYYCYSLKYCDFTSHTAVPTLSNTDAFGYIPTDFEIRVPAALYDEWIAATNWATYASQIVAV